MVKKTYLSILILAILWGFAVFFSGCDTGIETSPDPGILRVTLHSDPADTSIQVAIYTFFVSDDDFFIVDIFQGKAYKDSNYAILFINRESYKEEQITYNVIERESGEYTRLTIFESHLPPQDYNKIQFGITASYLVLGNIGVPVQSPPDADLSVALHQDFKITANKVTEIQVQLSPFKSVHRYRDTFHFIPEVQITGVKYY